VNRFLMAGSLALLSASAYGDQDRGFYLNANFGQAQYDISQDDLDSVALAAFESNGVAVLDSESSFDDEGSPWSISGGYRFSRYLAVEVGYLDLGSAEYDAAGTVLVPVLGGVLADSALGIDISSQGPTVAAAVYAPIGAKVDLHGRFGMFFADSSFDISVGLDDVTESDEVAQSSEDFFASAGAAFHFTPNFAASLDFTLFKDVGDELETDVDSLTLGLQYTF
jgi:OmpA-OmpF porin, OOP family